MSMFSELAADLGGAFSRGAAKGYDEEAGAQNDIRRQAQAFQALNPLREAYERRKMELASNLAMRNQAALEFMKQNRPQGNPLLSLLGKQVEIPQSPDVMPQKAGPNYGIGEESLSGAIPPTRTVSGDNLLLRSMGLDPKEHEVVPHLGEKGGISVGFPRISQNKPVPPHYVPRADGSVWVIDTPGSEPRMIKEPIKTAQPYTQGMENLRAVQDPSNPYYSPTFSGWKPGDHPSPEHQNAAVIFGRVQVPAERVGKQIEAQADRVKLISNISEAKALGGLTDEVIEQRSLQAKMIGRVVNGMAQDKAFQTALGKMKAELEKDETGTPYGAAIQEARLEGRPLSGTAATDVVKWNQYLRAANMLRKEYSDQEILKYVGYGKFQAKQLEQFIKTDPRFMRFMVLNEQLRGTAFGEGGKQLTPFEASVVFGYTPTGREAWGEYYTAKLDEIGPRFTQMINETLTAHRTARGKYSPSQVPNAQPGGSPSGQKAPTATGPNGQKLILQNGQWVPYGGQ